jgi:hypothetical protein
LSNISLPNTQISIRAFNKLFFVTALIIFVVAVIRAAVIPFSHDETGTFFYYIQRCDFIPFLSFHGDTNNHVLNSFLASICFRLFGDSPFVLRLPNLLALVSLILATYRLSARLTNVSSKIILSAGLLLSFHWLSYFEVCRGYGISMALLAFAFSYIPDFIENKKFGDVLKVYLFLNLALCANLTLLLAVMLITAMICVFQLVHRCFFKWPNILWLFIQAGIIVFWIKYGYFLQQENSLYAGAGNSYWEVTFVSLIDNLVGKENFWINASVVAAYVAVMTAGVYFFVKNAKQAQWNNQVVYKLFLFLLFNGLIGAFYLLKKIAGINFPEDRTGLFFYLLFIMNTAFILDSIKPRFSNIIAIVTFVGFAAHFAFSLNFSQHSLDLYKVMPERFYDRLISEQKQSPERITIGGGMMRELPFSFMNYRHDGALNPMDNPDDMLMNADYYVSFKSLRKFYAPYYNEIDSEDESGYTLLKRKQAITRKLLYAQGSQDVEMKKGEDYHNLYEIKDTEMASRNPLLIEFNFKVQDGDMPSLYWLVMAIDTAEGKPLYARRMALNWVKYDWPGQGKNEDYILESGPLPAKMHRLVCFLWNVKGQHLKLSMNSLKVYQLEGDGVNADASKMAKAASN